MQNFCYKMQEKWKTKICMVFDSIEVAWNFWAYYGGKVGFGSRKHYTHKKKDGSASSSRFVWCKEGFWKSDKREYKTINPKPETVTNCKATPGLKNVVPTLVVHEFAEEHNHDLHLSQTLHMLSSQQKVSKFHCNEIDLIDDACTQQRKSFDLMNKEVWGWSNLGFTHIDQKIHLRNRR